MKSFWLSIPSVCRDVEAKHASGEHNNC